MKNIIVALFILASLSLNAQWGNDVPNYNVNAGVSLSNEASKGINIGISSCYGCYSTVAQPGDAVIRTNGGGDLILAMKSSSGNGINRKVKIASDDNGTLLEVQNSGQIIMGTVPNTPSRYRLYVGDGILTERVKVALKSSSNWADYVFDRKYKLMPLLDVEKFIKKNKHLPNVLSAEQVVKEGIDMAEMDSKLLEKIEELTLYLIEMKKENIEMKKEIQIMKSKK